LLTTNCGATVTPAAFDVLIDYSSASVDVVPIVSSKVHTIEQIFIGSPKAKPDYKLVLMIFFIVFGMLGLGCFFWWLANRNVAGESKPKIIDGRNIELVEYVDRGADYLVDELEEEDDDDDTHALEQIKVDFNDRRVSTALGRVSLGAGDEIPEENSEQDLSEPEASSPVDGNYAPRLVTHGSSQMSMTRLFPAPDTPMSGSSAAISNSSPMVFTKTKKASQPKHNEDEVEGLSSVVVRSPDDDRKVTL